MEAPFHAEVADAPEGARARWLTTADGKRLRAVFWAGAGRGTALVFPGRTEYVEKYGRVVGALVARGFGVAVIDWRGQGLSERYPVAPLLGHVEDFAEYQRDVDALLDAPEVVAMPGPRVLIAHSMGGCVGLRTLLGPKGGDFAGAVFLRADVGLDMPAATRAFAERMTLVAGVLGLGARRMPGTRRHAAPDPAAFAGNALTSDPEQFAWAVGQMVAHPELALGPPSIFWTRAAMREMARLGAVAMPATPMLGLVGDDEKVVSRRAIAERFAAAKDGELLVLAGGRHELPLEAPAILARVWEGIDLFLARVAP